MSKEQNSGLRGGVRCTCGQEFEVICRPWNGYCDPPRGVSAAFFASVLELAYKQFGSQSLTQADYQKLQQSAATIESVFNNDERTQEHNATE